MFYKLFLKQKKVELSIKADVYATKTISKKIFFSKTWDILDPSISKWQKYSKGRENSNFRVDSGTN